MRDFGPKQLRTALSSVFDEERINKSLVISSSTDLISKNSPLKGVFGWIIPPLIRGSGGHRTIFQHIEGLATNGYECHCYILLSKDPPYNTRIKLVRAISEEFHCTHVKVHTRLQITEDLDLIFAGHWSTIAATLCSNITSKTYYIQDYEPSFFPMSGTYLAAENQIMSD